MIQSFLRLSAIKQKRILDACLEEFVLHGFEQASTNKMVEKARIPKGTLFHYFGSKKDLFLFLVDSAVQQYLNLLGEKYANPPVIYLSEFYILANQGWNLRFANHPCINFYSSFS